MENGFGQGGGGGGRTNRRMKRESSMDHRWWLRSNVKAEGLCRVRSALQTSSHPNSRPRAAAPDFKCTLSGIGRRSSGKSHTVKSLSNRWPLNWRPGPPPPERILRLRGFGNELPECRLLVVWMADADTSLATVQELCLLLLLLAPRISSSTFLQSGCPAALINARR